MEGVPGANCGRRAGSIPQWLNSREPSSTPRTRTASGHASVAEGIETVDPPAGRRIQFPRPVAVLGVVMSAVLALAFAAVAAPVKPVPLDPESATPYVWRIVVRTPTHPLVTPAFRDQLARDVKAALAPAAGEVARVEVVDLAAVPKDQWDPLWTAFADKGWDALDAAEFKPLTGVKTHFLRIDVQDTGFRVACRQHDGSTGFVSPAVRAKDTPTADTVGRLAGLLLAKDFGPVGTVVDSNPKEGTAKVRFRAGGLPGFDKFLEVGDVLAVAVVGETAGKPAAKGFPANPPVLKGQPREFVLLRVAGPVRDGACECKLFSRFDTPLPAAGRIVPGMRVVGVRCVKVATVEAPAQVRIVDKEGNPPPAGALIRVWANDIDFGRRPDPRDALEPRDGAYRSPRPLKGIGCITVGLGSLREERFPVPVLGGPVVLRFVVDETQAAKAAFERECDDFRNRVVEARTAQAALFDALGVLIPTGKYQAALDRATAGQAAATAADQQLAADLAKLKESPHAADALPAALLASADGQLRLYRGAMPTLADRIEGLKLAIEKAKDPVKFEKEFRARELTSRIRQMIEAGEVPDALDLYDQLIELTQSDDAKAQKAKLAAEWEPKSGDAKLARAVVADVWKKASTVAEYKDAAPKLSAAADVLIRENDRLGLRNLAGAIDPAYVRLKEQADLLDGESDRAALKELQAVAEAVRAIEAKAREHVKKLDGATP